MGGRFGPECRDAVRRRSHVRQVRRIPCQAHGDRYRRIDGFDIRLRPRLRPAVGRLHVLAGFTPCGSSGHLERLCILRSGQPDRLLRMGFRGWLDGDRTNRAAWFYAAESYPVTLTVTESDG